MWYFLKKVKYFILIFRSVDEKQDIFNNNNLRIQPARKHPKRKKNTKSVDIHKNLIKIREIYKYIFTLFYLMSDTFLQQIQSTETEAKEMIKNAKEEAQKELQQEEKRLQKERENALNVAREDAKKKILDKQSAMKKTYNDQVEKERKDIESQKRTIAEKESKVLSSTEHFFINDLLS